MAVSPSVATNISHPEPDRKSGSAGMPRPISYAVFCLKKSVQNGASRLPPQRPAGAPRVRPCACGAERGGERCRACRRRLGGGGGSLLPGRFFFNDPATPEIYTLSLHDALPISRDCVASNTEELNRDALEQMQLVLKAELHQIGRAVQQECRDRYRKPASGW